MCDNLQVACDEVLYQANVFEIGERIDIARNLQLSTWNEIQQIDVNKLGGTMTKVKNALVKKANNANVPSVLWELIRNNTEELLDNAKKCSSSAFWMRLPKHETNHVPSISQEGDFIHALQTQPRTLPTMMTGGY